MRLLRVELSRLRSRRAVVLLGLAAVLLAAVMTVLTAYQTRPLTAADRQDAAAQADLASRSSVLQSDLAECVKDPESYFGPGGTARDCREAMVDDVSSFYPRSALDLGTVLDAPRLTDATGFSLALALAVLMIVAGATFAGGDWTSGSVSNQLLFESRRTRVWLAKAGAIAIASGLLTLLAVGGFWAAVYLLADARGISVPGADVSHVLWHVVRAIALCMAAAVGGFALTMMFRNTVATLALVFIYSVVGEIAVGVVPVEGAGRVSMSNNVFGWLATRATYVDSSIDCSGATGCSAVQSMSHLEAGLFLGALLLFASALSVAVFRRADV